MSVMQAQSSPPDFFDVVTIRAVDYNPASSRVFDGSPFSHMPDWLLEEIENKNIVIHEDGRCTDYAVFKIKKGKDWHIVEPGDKIINHNGNIRTVVFTNDQHKILRTLSDELTRVRTTENASAHALDCIRQELKLDLIDGEHPSDTAKRISKEIQSYLY